MLGKHIQVKACGIRLRIGGESVIANKLRHFSSNVQTSFQCENEIVYGNIHAVTREEAMVRKSIEGRTG